MTAVAEKMQIHCPHCHKKLAVSARLAGRQGNCPACKGLFTVPEADEPYTMQLVEPSFSPAASSLPDDSQWLSGQSGAKKLTTRPRFTAAQELPKPKKRVLDEPSEGRSSSSAGVSGGVLGSLLLMVVAAGWFIAGWYAGYIYFYPPILFVAGLCGFFKSLFGSDD